MEIVTKEDDTFLFGGATEKEKMDPETFLMVYYLPGELDTGKNVAEMLVTCGFKGWGFPIEKDSKSPSHIRTGNSQILINLRTRLRNMGLEKWDVLWY